MFLTRSASLQRRAPSMITLLYNQIFIASDDIIFYLDALVHFVMPAGDKSEFLITGHAYFDQPKLNSAKC